MIDILCCCNPLTLICSFHDALEYMQFFLNSLGAVTKTLHSLKNDGRSAVETSFKLLLHAMYALEVDEKRKQLQLTVPFIKDWARVNVGENFSCGSDKDIQREHQVLGKWIFC